MKLYYCRSRAISNPNVTFVIQAESEWQARDIADEEDHQIRIDQAETDAWLDCTDAVRVFRKPYYTLGNGVVNELGSSGDAGVYFYAVDQLYI